MTDKLRITDRLDFLKSVCEGKKVLHLGCTNHPYTEQSIADGMLLHDSLKEISSSLYGFDFDPDGIGILERHGHSNLYEADLENLDAVELEETFDVIVAGEMIEHLNNPGRFLEGIQRFMDSETKLVITTVNAYSAMRLVMYAVSGKGGKNEPVHPDHVGYYSYSTLKLTVERMGLRVSDFYFYDVGREHRPFVRKPYLWLNDAAVRFWPQLSDGVIAVCQAAREN
ncbi:MAG: methyltransferase domain-containing protein [Pyrinomonadaceae bacterium]